MSDTYVDGDIVTLKVLDGSMSSNDLVRDLWQRHVVIMDELPERSAALNEDEILVEHRNPWNLISEVFGVWDEVALQVAL